MKIVLKILIVFIIPLSSCSSDVLLKKEVFDKVEIGMTIDQVKNILGEPAEIRRTLTLDSGVNYFYYIHNDLLKTDHAVVEFTKSGFVSFKFYGNPD